MRDATDDVGGADGRRSPFARGPTYPPPVATTRSRRPAGTVPPAPEDAPTALPAGPDEGATGDGAGASGPASTAPPATRDVSAILQRAVEEAAGLLRSDGAMAYLLDPATGVLRFAHDAGITDENRRSWVRSLRLEVGVGLFGQAVASGEVASTGDYPNDPSFVHFPEADRLVADLGIQSFVVAPLVAGPRTYGAMGTFAGRKDAFDDADVALVRSLADHAAAAMANADLIVQLNRSRADVERRAQAERALREIGGRIIALRHPEEVLQRSVDEAARLLRADGARIDLLDPADGALYWAYDATTGRRPGLGPIAGTGEARAGEGISGRAVREMRAIFTGDYLADDRFEHAAAPDEHVRMHAIRSVVAVPLIGDRGPLGTLTVYTSDVDAFDDDDARLIEALAGQAAIAMTNARLIEELDRSRGTASRQADAERALREIAARITAIRDPGDLLQHVVDEAARLLGAARARIDLVVPAGGRVGFTHVPGAGDIIGGAAVDETGRPFGYGASGKAIATGRTVVSTDYLADTDFEHDPSLDAAVRQDGVRSLIVTPLTGEEGLLGVLQVGWPEAGAFEPEEVELVEALAHQAAIAIQNARLIEALARSREEIRRRARAEQALREIATRITAIRDPSDLLQQVVDASRQLLDADRAQLDLVQPGSALIRWSHVSGAGRYGLPLPGTDQGTPVDQGINAPAISQRRAIVTGDYLTEERFGHVPASDAFVRSLDIHSVVAAPLFTSDGLLGVLKVASTRRDAYDDEDAALMEAFADQAVVAIQNARLIEELDRSRGAASRQADAERALRMIAADISAIRDPDELLQQTVDEARRLLDSDTARIDMLDGTTLRWTYASGEQAVATRDAGADTTVEVGKGVAGMAVQSGHAFRTGDYLADDRFSHTAESDALVDTLALHSVLAAPLLGESGVLGALTVSSHRNNAYDETAEGLLQALADQAAITIQNARLITELNASRTALRRRADAEQALREIAARISATKGARDVLQRTVDEAARLLDADEARIDLIDAESGLLRWAYHSATTTPTGNWDWPDEPDESLDQGVSGRAVLERRVAFTGDYLNDPSFLHSSGPDGFVAEVGINSVMSAPLLGEGGRPFGALTIYTRRKHAWADEDARLIEAIATQAAIAITNARLIEELDRSTGELARRADAEQSLREIAARITAIREPGPLLQQVVDAARRLVDGDGSILDLVDRVHNELRFAYDSGVRAGFSDDEVAQLTIPIGIGATGRAVVEDRVIVASGDLTSQFPEAPINDRFFEVTGFRSMIVAPVTGESGPLGAIEVYSNRDDAFDEGDAAVIRSLAYQAAIAIQNARLIEELERSQAALAFRAETERSLRDITARITSLRDPAEILARVVEESRRLLGSDGAHLTRIAEDGTYLVPVIVAGDTDESTQEWLKSMQFPLGGGINGLAAQEGRPIWTGDYLTDPRIPHEPDDQFIAERLGLRSMAAAPLRAPGGEVIGTLAISYGEPRDFLPDELDLLQGLADQAAIALTNSNLYELLGESEARYRHLVQNSPDLVWSIDAEARFTFVSDTCERLTGWRPDELLGRHFGALLHPSSKEVAEIDWTAGMTGEFQELRGRLNLLHRDGHAIPAEFSAYGTRDPDGGFAGANGSVRDMSEHDRLERELRESEERYRFLVENSPDIIYAVDEQGAFTYVSETIRRALGYDPDDLIGQPFSRIVHYETPGQEGIRFAQLKADPTLEITSRLQLIHADGHLVPFEVSSVGVVRDGAFAGVHGSGRDIVDRERLERELRESEARYRFLVENSPDIIFSIDPLGRLSYISESSVLITGRSPEESIGRRFIEFVAPEDTELAARSWDDLHAEPGVARTIRLRLLNAAGVASPYEVSMVGIAAEDGRFLGVQGTSRDIRERERLERELRESEERYRFLVENSPDIIFSTDAEGRYTYYSETVEGMTGYKPAELMGRHFASIVDLETFPEASDAWRRFEEHPTRMQVNRFSLRTRDDRRVPVEVSAIGMTDEHGRFAGIHGSARDVRERERLERELRASEERYRYLVKASPDVVWAVDEDGRITFMSDRIEELAGYQPEEIVGKHFVDMTDPGSLARTEATWEAVRRDPTGVYPLKVHLRRRVGDPVPAEVWVTGMLRDGEFAGAHGSIRDMREREGYERDLRRQAAELASSQERAHLARELHDSVTQALFSMTLVTRTTEILVDRDPAAAKEKLSSLRELQREALAEMRALIFELRPGNIEQDGLLPALKTHTAALQGRIGLPIVVTSDLAERLPLALEEVLYRISQEALHNVVKHAAARQVTLSIDRAGGGVRLRIADDGKGFDAAAVPDGHLGLAGMRARAAKIGASFEVTSEAGRGTTIEVAVPDGVIAAARASAPLGERPSAE